MITDAQEAALAARRAQTAQDKRNPFSSTWTMAA